MVSLFGASCWFVFQHDHLKGLSCSCTSVRKTSTSCCVVRFLKYNMQLFSCVRGAAIVKMPTNSPNSQRVKAGLKLTSRAWLYDRMEKSLRLTCFVWFRLGWIWVRALLNQKLCHSCKNRLFFCVCVKQSGISGNTSKNKADNTWGFVRVLVIK